MVLNLDENEIAECDFCEHATVKVLSLNKNKLASGAGLRDLPCLEELSIQENETLTSLKGRAFAFSQRTGRSAMMF